MKHERTGRRVRPPRHRSDIDNGAIQQAVKDAMREVRGDEVRIPGFGTFKVAHRKARKARNPQTGAEMMLKAARVPKFQASKSLKDKLN